VGGLAHGDEAGEEAGELELLGWKSSLMTRSIRADFGAYVKPIRHEKSKNSGSRTIWQAP